MNRTIRIHRTGGPECLQLDELPMPAPARGEVVLRHTAIGVNFLDCHHRRGDQPLPSLPSGVGIEAVGVVVALGEGVHGVHAGERVGYGGGVPPGSYAEHRAVPAWRVVPIPPAVDDVTAAAVLCKGLTAEYLVRRTFKVGPGHRVLVHAAAGALGLLLCQWLRHLGATVFGVVSTDAKAEIAVANGCHHPIVVGADAGAAANGLPAVVRRITQDKGVDVVYDGVGRATIHASLQCLRRRGLLVSFGNASGAPEPLDLADLRHGGSLFVTRPSLPDYTATRQELQRAAAAMLALVQGGVLRPRIDATLPLASAAAAHARLEARQSAGAMVLLP